MNPAVDTQRLAFILYELRLPAIKQIWSQFAAHAGRAPATLQTLSTYLIEIARLGGYLGRRRDPPPGNMIMWRG